MKIYAAASLLLFALGGCQPNSAPTSAAAAPNSAPTSAAAAPDSTPTSAAASLLLFALGGCQPTTAPTSAAAAPDSAPTSAAAAPDSTPTSAAAALDSAPTSAAAALDSAPTSAAALADPAALVSEPAPQAAGADGLGVRAARAHYQRLTPFDESPLGAQKLLEAMLLIDRPAIEFTLALKPDLDDYAVVFTQAAAARARQVYPPVWATGRIQIQPQPGQVRARLYGATTEELQAGTGNAHYFSPRYREIAQYLEPGRTWYHFRFTAPHAEQGTHYDGLTYVRDHWALFPEPWRALSKLLPTSEAAPGAPVSGAPAP